MIFPNPISKEKICRSKNILVIKECFCHNGHNLISDKAVFNEFNGIVFKIKNKDHEGLVALSPVYGYKSRVSMDVDLNEGDIWEVLCPECNEKLPIFSECSCNAELVTIFLSKCADFSNCITLCNRIGCFNACIQYGNEAVTMSMIQNQ